MLKLPSLRERSNDIPVLINHFIQNLKNIYCRENLTVTAQASNYLKNMLWSGNIRELKNLVERTVLVSNKDVLDVEDFSIQMQSNPQKQAGQNLPAVGTMTLDEIELSMIKKAMEFHNGNISQIAKSLGLSRYALYRRMERYGIKQ